MTVDDANRLYDHLVEHGVRIIKGLRDADYGLRGFVFADPDGNRIDVGQPLVVGRSAHRSPSRVLSTICAVKGMAVVYVKDLPRMQTFYQATFRMETVDEADDYSVLESEVLTLSLVVVPDRIAAGIVLSDPPARREAVPVKLAFAVESIDDLRPVVAQLGGVLDPLSTAWEFRGGIHCDGVDPEGNVIQLVQPIAQTTSPTDR